MLSLRFWLCSRVEKLSVLPRAGMPPALLVLGCFLGAQGEAETPESCPPEATSAHQTQTLPLFCPQWGPSALRLLVCFSSL